MEKQIGKPKKPRAKRRAIAPTERETKNYWVTMSNALTRAGQGLTLAEKRLVAACIAKMDSARVYQADEECGTELLAFEYAETYQVDINTAYEALQDAAKHLYERSITMVIPAYYRGQRKIGPAITKFRWVYRIEYHKTEGRVSVYWSPNVRPHLTALRKNFTSYQLVQASALRSVYSWRLLELLMRYRDSGWAEYAIEDFCVAMDLSEKQRANFNNIRRVVIDTAVRELQDKDGWKIEWKPVKAGRRVRAVYFQFCRDAQGRLEL